MKYNTIILGLGAMGSAAIYQLAKRGDAVVGIDRYSPPHAMGSSHGDTRITRQAIGEGEHYTPLALRSYEIWRELEMETGRNLLTITGGLIISTPARPGCNNVADFYGNTVRAAQRYGIAHELLTTAQIRQRFPQFNVQDGELGYWERDAGFLRPERCIATQLELAEREGAVLKRDEEVLGFAQHGQEVVVATNRSEYRARHLIVTAGPWLPQMLPAAERKLFTVARQILFWFEAQGEIAPFEVGRFPIYIWEPTGMERGIYGFPAIDGAQGGVKLSSAHYDDTAPPNEIRREVTATEIGQMYRAFVRPLLPGLSPRCVKAAVCMYTVTPDYGFVIDRHPEFDRIMIASPCSGHGFKHSPAVGEALAEWVIEGRRTSALAPFSLERFKNVCSAARL